MKSYDELKALIERRGVHAEFGGAGEGWGIEQNPHELATFLVRMQELGVASVLEIGTGYRGGLSRFLAHDLHWDVTTVDIKNYGHAFEGVHFIILGSERNPNPIRAYWRAEGYDLVFIDGDHNYSNVKDDYVHYHEAANKVVAFHDIAGLRDCEGVEKFWIEIATLDYKLKPKHFSVYDFSPRAGIGWIEL